MSDSSTDNQKHVEFYAAAVAGWINTSLEHDKSLLTLAAGGLGLLLTLLTAVGVTSAALLVLYICAIAAFLFSLVSVLAIFQRNKVHIQRMLDSGETRDRTLNLLDSFAVGAFAIGALLTAIIAISTALSSYVEKDRTMANSKSPAPSSEHLGKSLNGLSNLQPKPSSSSAPQAPATQTPAPAPAGSSTQGGGAGGSGGGS